MLTLRKLVLYFAVCAVAWPAGVALGQDQPMGAVCWIYRNIPAAGAAEDRSPSELVYQPHFVYPVARSEGDVAINDRLTDPDSKDEEPGTVCQFGFRLPASTFAGVKWIPGGSEPGTREGLDIHRELRATRATPVYLTFRARTTDGAKAKVTFRLGATGGQQFNDSLRFSEVAKPSPTPLSGKWTTISIPLKGKDLSSVICPLEVLVKADDNPDTETVDVFVDDVRFEVKPR